MPRIKWTKLLWTDVVIQGDVIITKEPVTANDFTAKIRGLSSYAKLTELTEQLCSFHGGFYSQLNHSKCGSFNELWNDPIRGSQAWGTLCDFMVLGFKKAGFNLKIGRNKKLKLKLYKNHHILISIIWGGKEEFTFLFKSKEKNFFKILAKTGLWCHP